MLQSPESKPISHPDLAIMRSIPVMDTFQSRSRAECRANKLTMTREREHKSKKQQTNKIMTPPIFSLGLLCSWMLRFDHLSMPHENRQLTGYSLSSGKVAKL